MKLKKKFIVASRAGSKSKKVRRAVDHVLSEIETLAPVESRTENEFRKFITNEGIDAIVGADLRSVRDNLIDDLKRRLNGDGIAIFDSDLSEDVRLIAAHVLAFDIVLRYYGQATADCAQP